MNIDFRDFKYALEPLRRRRIWQLDAAKSDLHRVESGIRRQEAAVMALHSEHALQNLHAGNVIAAMNDPVGYPRLLRWLVQLRDAIQENENILNGLHAQRDQARERCLVRQRQLDVVERHREKSLAEFIVQDQRRASAENDREWLTRRHWVNVQCAGDTRELVS